MKFAFYVMGDTQVMRRYDVEAPDIFKARQRAEERLQGDETIIDIVELPDAGSAANDKAG